MPGRAPGGWLLTGALLSSACGSEPAPPAAPIEVVDDAGDTVRLETPAQRVASLIPAQTDIVLALGAADRLVVRTHWDSDDRLANVPSVGNALTPSVEWLASQQPDLVLAWIDAQSRTAVSRLRELGVPVYASRVQTLADVERSVQRIGMLLGLEQRADSLVAHLRADIAATREAVAGEPSPSVLYLIGLDPPMAAGPGTYIHELIGVAGGVNVFGDAAGLWPTVSLEEVVRREPDHIVMAMEAPNDELRALLAPRPGWRDVPAVRQGRVHQVEPEMFNRPGPYVGAAALRLAQLLHPSATGEAKR